MNESARIEATRRRVGIRGYPLNGERVNACISAGSSQATGQNGGGRQEGHCERDRGIGIIGAARPLGRGERCPWPSPQELGADGEERLSLQGREGCAVMTRAYTISCAAFT